MKVFTNRKEFVDALTSTTERVNLFKGRFIPDLDTRFRDEYFVFYVVRKQFFNVELRADDVMMKESYIASYSDIEDAENLKNFLCPEGGQYKDQSFEIVIREMYYTDDEAEGFKEWLRFSAA